MHFWRKVQKPHLRWWFWAPRGRTTVVAGPKTLVKYASKCIKNIIFDIQYPVWPSGMGFSDFLYIGVCMHSHIQTSVRLLFSHEQSVCVIPALTRMRWCFGGLGGALSDTKKARCDVQYPVSVPPIPGFAHSEW